MRPMHLARLVHLARLMHLRAHARLMLLMLLALVRGPCAAYALLTTGAAYARLMRC
jgi:hypothetical protein